MSQAKNKVVIELYGAPGVGKTTLAETLVREYGYVRILPQERRFKHLFFFLQFPFTVTGWLMVIVGDFLRLRDRTIFRYNVSLLFSALQRIYDAYHCPQEFVVIDEGLLQRFLSFSDSIHSSVTIKLLMALGPIGNVVVLVNNREVVSDRYEKQQIRTNRGQAYLATWRKNLAENLIRVEAVSRSHKRPLFFATVETPVSAIIDKINTLINESL